MVTLQQWRYCVQLRPGDRAYPDKGVCIGFLGLSGFECGYLGVYSIRCLISLSDQGVRIEVPPLKTRRFIAVLQNIHLSTIVLNATQASFIALIPLPAIRSAPNILNILAHQVIICM